MKKAINIGIFAEDTPYEQIFACLKSAGYAAAELNLFEEKKPFPSLWNGADEAELKALVPDGLPEEIKEAYENAHA